MNVRAVITLRSIQPSPITRTGPLSALVEYSALDPERDLIAIGAVEVDVPLPPNHREWKSSIIAAVVENARTLYGWTVTKVIWAAPEFVTEATGKIVRTV